MPTDKVKAVRAYPGWMVEKLGEAARLAETNRPLFDLHFCLIAPDNGKAAAKRLQRQFRSLRRALRFYTQHPLARLEHDFDLSLQVTWDSGGGIVALRGARKTDRTEATVAGNAALWAAISR